MLPSRAVEEGAVNRKDLQPFDLADPAGHLLLTRTPVLLIHGFADTNIPPRHVRLMHAANPAMLTLWLVDGARHVGAWRKEPKAYESRVLGFFASHEPAATHQATQ
jgi:uncharacterized protein